MVTQNFEAKTKALIDNLKGICANYGLGNDGNEFKIITQVFLYKFMNDKFGYEVKKVDNRLKNAENWEQEIANYSEDESFSCVPGRKLAQPWRPCPPSGFLCFPAESAVAGRLTGTSSRRRVGTAPPCVEDCGVSVMMLRLPGRCQLLMSLVQLPHPPF